MQLHTRSLADITVRYCEHGDGPPAVMIHGLAEDHQSWRDVQSGLGGSRSFAYDLRGHGGSSLGQADGTLAQLGEDLVRFLENVTGPARCLGYSLGGTVVLWAASQRPDLVSHAVVSGTSSVVGRAAVGFFEQRIRTLQSDSRQFAVDLRADTQAQIMTKDVDVDAVAAARLAAVGDGGGYINAARAMMGVHRLPLTPCLGQLRCPVDVIYGDQDVFCPQKAAQIIFDAVSDGALHEIQSAGHLMSVDQPAAYLSAFQTALRRSCA